MKVLVIPEDFRKDQYVLKPIVQAMLASLGQPNSIVRVCLDPLLGGVHQATRWDRIAEILELYAGMIDLFLLCIDRDGDPGRRTALDRIEARAAATLPQGRLLLTEHAWQELEVWVLAGHLLQKGWVWKDIRAERDPKERYYLPFAKSRGLHQTQDEGRGTLSREAAQNYRRLKQRCPEDIGALHAKIEAWLASRRTR